MKPEAYLESFNGPVYVAAHDLVLFDEQPRTQPALWVDTLGSLAGEGVRLARKRAGFMMD